MSSRPDELQNWSNPNEQHRQILHSATPHRVAPAKSLPNIFGEWARTTEMIDFHRRCDKDCQVCAARRDRDGFNLSASADQIPAPFKRSEVILTGNPAFSLLNHVVAI
jgi:hypothetical protein